MIYIFTNLNKDSKQLLRIKHNKLIFYRPWGFSKANIKKEIINLIKLNKIKKEDIVKYKFDNLFFGNRAKFVEIIVSDYFNKK